MKKYFLYYFTFSILLYACSDSKQILKPSFIAQNKVDTSRIAIISSDLAGIYNETDTSWFTKTLQPTHLTETEMFELEEILNICIDSNYKFNKRKMDSQKWLSMYKRQYVPFTNEKGEKLVWVNCFIPYDFYYWKSAIVSPNSILMSDGGEWLLNVTINLTTKKYNRLVKINNGLG